MKKKLKWRFPVAFATVFLLSTVAQFSVHPARADDTPATSTTSTAGATGAAGATTTADAPASDNSATSSSDTSTGTSKTSAPNVETHEPISQANANEVDDDDAAGKFSATYFGIFYGPNVTSPSHYQANQDGIPESDKPIMLKNFLGLGYNLADHIRVTPTAYWQWLPTSGGAYSFQDPFVTLSDDAIISDGGWNLYGDIRYHAPLSSWSQAADEQGSIQTVQVLSYVPDGSRFMFAAYGSQREYFYGSNGYGDDLELYFGPNVNYQLTPSVQLTVLYELNLCHVYQTDPSVLQGDGQDIEPGVSWDISDHINLHPYLNIYPTNLSINDVGMGMLLYWQAF